MLDRAPDSPVASAPSRALQIRCIAHFFFGIAIVIRCLARTACVGAACTLVAAAAPGAGNPWSLATQVPAPAGAEPPVPVTRAPAADADAAAADGSLLRVFLMTMGPGDAVWERFGHNALWVHDPVAGTDHAYNYGLFSFEQPGFVRRFLMGRMLYSMAPGDAHLTVRAYAQINRSVWVQELALTAAQKLELQQFLEWNALPENRDYLYDYYYDNCSTRLRDAVDLVTGGAVRAALDTVHTGHTLRSHSLRLTHDDIPTFTGLLLAMGAPVDAPITAWQESFIPMQLSEHLQRVIVSDENGRALPLAAQPRLLFSADREDPPQLAPRRLPQYLATGFLIAAVLLALAHFARRAPGLARTSFGMAAAVWAGTVGLFGTIIVLLWAVTDHHVTGGNANVLLANPASLVLAVMVPLMLVRRGRYARIALAVAALSAVLAVIAVLVALLPVHGQRSGEMVALLGPAHVALLYAVYSIGRKQLSSEQDARGSGGSFPARVR